MIITLCTLHRRFKYTKIDKMTAATSGARAMEAYPRVIPILAVGSDFENKSV